MRDDLVVFDLSGRGFPTLGGEERGSADEAVSRRG